MPRRLEGERRAVILYDRDCGFCRVALAVVLRADRRRRLCPVALGTARADHLLRELDPTERAASWHLVSPGGGRASAGAAVPELLELLPGGLLPAGVLTRFPGLTERGYRWVADHRSALSRLLPGGAKRRATSVIDARS